MEGLLSSKDKGKAKELKMWCKFWGHQMVEMAESQGLLTGEGGWVEVQNETRAYYNGPIFSVR